MQVQARLSLALLTVAVNRRELRPALQQDAQYEGQGADGEWEMDPHLQIIRGGGGMGRGLSVDRWMDGWVGARPSGCSGGGERASAWVGPRAQAEAGQSEGKDHHDGIRMALMAREMGQRL